MMTLTDPPPPPPRMPVRRAKLSELHADPANARQHDEKNLDAIAASLKQFGQVEPLVVQKSTGKVIGGNGRMEVLRRAGETEVDIVEVDVNDTQAAALGIALNRTGELAGWDDQALAKLLESLPDDAFAATGFSDDDLGELLDKLAPGTVEEDEVPPVPADPVSRTGDLWLLGDHKLLCGDSTKDADVRRVTGGTAADLLFCDPPYGVAYQTKLSHDEAVARNRRRDGLEVANDDLGTEGTRALVADALRIAAGHLRDGAAFYVCAPAGCSADGDMGLAFRAALNDAGLRLRQAIVWVKDIFVMGRQDYHWRHEDILYGWKEGAAHYFVDDRTLDTVWEIPRPKRSEHHPTTKPLELVARALRNSTRAGQVVLDVFMGSGSTLVACEQLGRRCLGLEIAPRYADVCVMRWQDQSGRAAVLDGDGRSFGRVAAERLGTVATEKDPGDPGVGENGG